MSALKQNSEAEKAGCTANSEPAVRGCETRRSPFAFRMMMKPRIKFRGTVLAVGLALIAGGCAKEIRSKAPEGPTAVLAKIEMGAPIPMVLLSELSAGGSQVGDKVAFMVWQDVKDREGHLAIPRGALAYGEVVASRSEGMLTSMINRPARLAVQFGELRTPEGFVIKLAPGADGLTDEPYSFSRADSSQNAISDELQKMIAGSDKPSVEALAGSLQSFLQTGDSSKLESDANAKAALERLLNAKGLEDAKKFLVPDSSSKESLDSLGKMLNEVKSGSMTSLSGSNALLAISALQELGRLTHCAENALSRLTKGRSLKAHFGTAVTAFAAENVEVSHRP